MSMLPVFFVGVYCSTRTLECGILWFLNVTSGLLIRYLMPKVGPEVVISLESVNTFGL